MEGSKLGNNLNKIKLISGKEMEVSLPIEKFTEMKSRGDHNIVPEDVPKCGSACP